MRQPGPDKSEPTPAALGYRMPAEWEPHAATWLAWPHNRPTWPDGFERIPPLWSRLVEVLAAGEAVHIAAGADQAMAAARAAVGRLSNVRLHDIPTNDAWIRDHGPIFLVGPPGTPPALVDWDYNAWGGKYPPYDADNAVPRQVAQLTGRKRFVPGLVLEGGAIDTNGRGTLLAARSCLAGENRNPGWTAARIERRLGEYLGARHVVWLDGRLAGDDTDGHVDQLARFVGRRRVVAAVERDPGDVNHEPLGENLRRLRAAVDEQGRPLEVIELPMPRPLVHNAVRLPASYANFYIANRVLVVPRFHDPADARALEILAGLFPHRQVVGLDAVDLLQGLGSYHCITQQEPA